MLSIRPRALSILPLLLLSACAPERRDPEGPVGDGPALDPLAGPAPAGDPGLIPEVAGPEVAGPALGGPGGVAPAPAPASAAAPVAAPDLPLGDPIASMPVERSTDGAWIVRRAGGSLSDAEGDDLVGGIGGLVPAKGEAYGGGGLGLRGTGVGGGGASDGLGGLGTKGAGSGAGSGYGRGDSAAAAPAARARPLPGAPPLQQQPSLRAGMTDDNANFDAYLQFVGAWQGAPGPAGALDRLDVSGQRRVEVRDSRGRPLPGARVDVVRRDTGETVWTAFTTGDGRAPYYPQLVVPGWGRPAPGAPERVPLRVVVRAEGRTVEQDWSAGLDALQVEVPAAPPAEAAVPVDVCFIIDTTGSMGDEIARVQETLLSVTQRLRGSQAVDLRYGAVLYRDVGDQYLTQAHPLTTDLVGFDRAIQQISASGGGDGPESLNQGLSVAVGDMDWRPGAAKVAFLIADAPPHMDYQERVTYGRAAAGAAHKGIRVHTVAASGLDDAGSAVFRQIAQLTRGRFIFIEYGSTAASAADHGVTGSVASNNLDQIVYDRIRAEVDGWRGGAAAVAAR